MNKMIALHSNRHLGCVSLRTMASYYIICLTLVSLLAGQANAALTFSRTNLYSHGDILTIVSDTPLTNNVFIKDKSLGNPTVSGNSFQYVVPSFSPKKRGSDSEIRDFYHDLTIQDSTGAVTFTQRITFSTPVLKGVKPSVVFFDVPTVINIEITGGFIDGAALPSSVSFYSVDTSTDPNTNLGYTVIQCKTVGVDLVTKLLSCTTTTSTTQTATTPDLHVSVNFGSTSYDAQTTMVFANKPTFGTRVLSLTKDDTNTKDILNLRIPVANLKGIDTSKISIEVGGQLKKFKVVNDFLEIDTDVVMGDVTVGMVLGGNTVMTSRVPMLNPVFNDLSVVSGSIAGGTPIDIIGDDFFNKNLKVTIDGKDCANIVFSQTKISCETPENFDRKGPLDVVLWIDAVPYKHATKKFTYSAPTANPTTQSFKLFMNDKIVILGENFDSIPINKYQLFINNIKESTPNFVIDINNNLQADVKFRTGTALAIELRVDDTKKLSDVGTISFENPTISFDATTPLTTFFLNNPYTLKVTSNFPCPATNPLTLKIGGFECTCNRIDDLNSNCIVPPSTVPKSTEIIFSKTGLDPIKYPNPFVYVLPTMNFNFLTSSQVIINSGRNIIITGSNLDQITSLRIGKLLRVDGTDCTYTAAPSEIRCPLTPGITGSQQVSVIIAGSNVEYPVTTSTNTLLTFNYNGPSITSISSTSSSKRVALSFTVTVDAGSATNLVGDLHKRNNADDGDIILCKLVFVGNIGTCDKHKDLNIGTYTVRLSGTVGGVTVSALEETFTHFNYGPVCIGPGPTNPPVSWSFTYRLSGVNRDKDENYKKDKNGYLYADEQDETLRYFDGFSPSKYHPDSPFAKTFDQVKDNYNYIAYNDQAESGVSVSSDGSTWSAHAKGYTIWEYDDGQAFGIHVIHSIPHFPSKDTNDKFVYANPPTKTFVKPPKFGQHAFCYQFEDFTHVTDYMTWNSVHIFKIHRKKDKEDCPFDGMTCTNDDDCPGSGECDTGICTDTIGSCNMYYGIRSQTATDIGIMATKSKVVAIYTQAQQMQRTCVNRILTARRDNLAYLQTPPLQPLYTNYETTREALRNLLMLPATQLNTIISEQNDCEKAFSKTGAVNVQNECIQHYNEYRTALATHQSAITAARTSFNTAKTTLFAAINWDKVRDNTDLEDHCYGTPGQINIRGISNPSKSTNGRMFYKTTLTRVDSADWMPSTGANAVVPAKQLSYASGGIEYEFVELFAPWELIISANAKNYETEDIYNNNAKYDGIDLWEVMATRYFQKKMFVGIYLNGESPLYPTASLATAAKIELPRSLLTRTVSGTVKTFPKDQFIGTNDHSKLAFTMNPNYDGNGPNDNMFCVGDSNRHDNQPRRGGGIFCIQNFNLVIQFHQFMKAYRTLSARPPYLQTHYKGDSPVMRGMARLTINVRRGAWNREFLVEIKDCERRDYFPKLLLNGAATPPLSGTATALPPVAKEFEISLKRNRVVTNIETQLVPKVQASHIYANVFNEANEPSITNQQCPAGSTVTVFYVAYHVNVAAICQGSYTTGFQGECSQTNAFRYQLTGGAAVNIPADGDTWLNPTPIIVHTNNYDLVEAANIYITHLTTVDSVKTLINTRITNNALRIPDNFVFQMIYDNTLAVSSVYQRPYIYYNTLNCQEQLIFNMLSNYIDSKWYISSLGWVKGALYALSKRMVTPPTSTNACQYIDLFLLGATHDFDLAQGLRATGTSTWSIPNTALDSTGFYSSAMTVWAWLGDTTISATDIVDRLISLPQLTSGIPQTLSLYYDTQLGIHIAFSGTTMKALLGSFTVPTTTSTMMLRSSRYSPIIVDLDNQTPLQTLISSQTTINPTDILNLSPSNTKDLQESFDEWIELDGTNQAIKILLLETQSNSLAINYIDEVQNFGNLINLCYSRNSLSGLLSFKVCDPMSIVHITGYLKYIQTLPSTSVFDFGDLQLYYSPKPNNYQPIFNKYQTFDALLLATVNSKLCDIQLVNQDDLNSIVDIGIYQKVGPIITSIQPTQQTSNNLLTINGLNFNQQSKVSVGGLPCQTTTFKSSTQLICQLPSDGCGSLQSVSINTIQPSIQKSIFYFTYNLPSINNIEQATINTIGSDIVINGNNFGNDISKIIVRIGQDDCLVKSATPTSIVCSAPNGNGINKVLSVYVGNQINNENYISLNNSLVSYQQPTFIFDQTQSISYALDYLYLQGNSFLSDIPLSLQVGSVDAKVLEVEDDYIGFILPESIPIDRQLSISLDLGDNIVQSTIKIGSGDPYVRKITTVDGGLYPTTGGIVRFYGKGFGFSQSDIQITLGGNQLDSCSTFGWFMECSIPRGIGPKQSQTLAGFIANKPLVFDFDTSLTSNIGYLPPTITSLTIESSILTINGNNFDTNPSTTSTNVILIDNNSNNLGCTNMISSVSMITCTIPDNLIMTVQVIVGGQSSNIQIPPINQASTSINLFLYVDQDIQGIPTTTAIPQSKIVVTASTNGYSTTSTSDSNGNISFKFFKGPIQITFSNTADPTLIPILNRISFNIDGTPVSKSFGFYILKFYSTYPPVQFFESFNYGGSYLSLPVGKFVNVLSNLGFTSKVHSFISSANYYLFLASDSLGNNQTPFPPTTTMKQDNINQITYQIEISYTNMFNSTIGPTTPILNSGESRTLKNPYINQVPQVILSNSVTPLTCTSNSNDATMTCNFPASSSSLKASLIWNSLPLKWDYDIAYAINFIKGTLFSDLNNNNVFDNGEPTFAGYTVTLGSKTVTTDSQGQYQFEITKGISYTLSVPTPTGYLALKSSYQVSLSTGNLLQFNIPMFKLSDNGCVGTLTSGTNQFNIQFGTYKLSSFGWCASSGTCQYPVSSVNLPAKCVYTLDSANDQLSVSVGGQVNINLYSDPTVKGVATTTPITSGLTIKIIDSSNNELTFTPNAQGKATTSLPYGSYTITFVMSSSQLFPILNNIPFQISATSQTFDGSYGFFNWNYNSNYPPVQFFQQSNFQGIVLSLPLGVYDNTVLNTLSWSSKTVAFKAGSKINVQIFNGATALTMTNTGNVVLSPPNPTGNLFHIIDNAMFSNSVFSNFPHSKSAVTIDNYYLTLPQIKITLVTSKFIDCQGISSNTKMQCQFPLFPSSSVTALVYVNSVKLYTTFTIKYSVSTISGKVFSDTNLDNQYGTGDTLLANVKVTLKYGTTTSESTTDSNGQYSFNDVTMNQLYTISIPTAPITYMIPLQSQTIYASYSTLNDATLNFGAQKLSSAGCSGTIQTASGQVMNIQYGTYNLNNFGWCKSPSICKNAYTTITIPAACQSKIDSNNVLKITYKCSYRGFNFESIGLTEYSAKYLTYTYYMTLCGISLTCGSSSQSCQFGNSYLSTGLISSGTWAKNDTGTGVQVTYGSGDSTSCPINRQMSVHLSCGATTKLTGAYEPSGTCKYHTYMTTPLACGNFPVKDCGVDDLEFYSLSNITYALIYPNTEAKQYFTICSNSINNMCTNYGGGDIASCYGPVSTVVSGVTISAYLQYGKYSTSTWISNPNYIGAMVTYTYTDTQVVKCDDGITAMENKVNLICNDDYDARFLINQGQKCNGQSYVFTPKACPTVIPNCQYNGMDFSSLAKTAYGYTFTGYNQVSKSIFFKICGTPPACIISNSVGNIQSCTNTPSAPNTVLNVATLKTGVWSILNDGIGAQVVYSGGTCETASGVTKKTTIQLECGSTFSIKYITELSACQFVIRYSTPLACAPTKVPNCQFGGFDFSALSQIQYQIGDGQYTYRFSICGTAPTCTSNLNTDGIAACQQGSNFYEDIGQTLTGVWAQDGTGVQVTYYGRRDWTLANYGRTTTIHISCGTTHQALSAKEPESCQYDIYFQTPYACSASTMMATVESSRSSSMVINDYVIPIAPQPKFNETKIIISTNNN